MHAQQDDIFGLGIDAGGTYTDAVILHLGSGRVVSWAKAFTTPADPIGGIRDALKLLPAAELRRVNFASLATTFATNAIVENRGKRAGLILIGYHDDHPTLAGVKPILRIAGGHNYSGEEQEPLGLEQLQEELDRFCRDLEAVAVAGYFSVSNPEHELRVAELVRQRCHLPVVCGHRLSMRLDAPRRGATAWWNARLIPLIDGLIRATEKVLAEFDLRVPLMVVRGDGTLMSASLAKERPVETILSGPAASILGARHLSGLEDALVVDMGGTTTDMAVLFGGRVEIDPEGAEVGGWKTLVEAARVKTVGLGGDSIVHTRDGTIESICLGPQRVEPLCVLAERFPGVVATLDNIAAGSLKWPIRLANPCTFYFASPGCASEAANLADEFLQGPVNEYVLLAKRQAGFSRWRLEAAEAAGTIRRASLTPTDLCVARGQLGIGSARAAQLGLSLFARGLRLPAEQLQRAIEREVQRRLCLEAATYLAGKDAAAVAALEKRWFNGQPAASQRPDLTFRLQLSHPVIGTGAPAATWMPGALRHLQAECILPELFSVGTAVGAVVGTVDFTLTAEIRPAKSEHYSFTLHGPLAREQFSSLEDAVAAGRQQLEAVARERMRKNNVAEPLLHFSTEKHAVKVWGTEIHLSTRLYLHASGRVNLGQG